MGAALLMYGLCRTTRQDMRRFIDRCEVPLTFLTEEDGSIADDCFGAVLGGRKRYLEAMKENKGTIFITTGYAEHWVRKQADRPLDKVVQQVESYRELFEKLGYNRVLMLDTGLGDSEEFQRRTDIFASIFDFTIDKKECDLSMFDRTYGLAKERLRQGAHVSGVLAR